MTKQKTAMTVMSVIVVLALAIGGTLAYLTATDTETNEFGKNTVTIDLSETAGKYEIVPGLEQTKDPVVSGSVTLSSYVFLEVDNETGGLVTFDIDSGWEELTSASSGNKKVYCREVTVDTLGTETPYEFHVLAGDKVTYDSSITNEQMNSAASPLLLTFTSYVVQQYKSGSVDANGQIADGTETFTRAEAWELVNGTSTSVANSTPYSNDSDATMTTSMGTMTVPAESTLYSDEDETEEIDSSSISSLTLEIEAQQTNTSDTDITVADDQAALYYDVSLYATTTTTTDDETTTSTTEVKKSSSLITATLNIGAGKTVVAVYHDGVAMSTAGETPTADTFSYDSDTGILTLYVNSFSPFAVVYSIPATGIEMPETATVTVGDTTTLTATVTPSNTTDQVAWTSSDPSVATVDANGVVTGVAKGTATITATANVSASKSCAVTVVAEGEGNPVTLTESQYKYNASGNYYQTKEAIILTAPLNGGTAQVTIPARKRIDNPESTALQLIITKSTADIDGQSADIYVFNVTGIEDYINYTIYTIDSLPCGFKEGDILYKYEYSTNLYVDITGYIGQFITLDSDAESLNLGSIQANNMTFGVVHTDPAEAGLVDLKDIQTTLSVDGTTITKNDNNSKGERVKSSSATITANNFTLSDLTVLSASSTSGGLTIVGNNAKVENAVINTSNISSYATTLKIKGSNATVKNTSINHIQMDTTNRYAGLEFDTDTESSVTTVDNVTLTGQQGLLFRSFAGTLNVTNSTINVSGSALKINVDSGSYTGKVTVKGSQITASDMSFFRVNQGVTFESTTFTAPTEGGTMNVSVTEGTTNVTFKDCTINSAINFEGTTTAGSTAILVFDNCTYKGQVITEDNIQEMFTFSVSNSAYSMNITYDGTTITAVAVQNS